MVGSGGWRWIKAPPTLLPLFDPSEKRRTSLSQGGRGKTKLGLKSALVGSGDELSGRGRPTRLRVGKVCSDHSLRSEASLSMWRGGRPQDWVEFHSLVLGYRTAWRPVKGSRQGVAVGKLGGRAAAAGLLVGWAHVVRRA